MGRITLPTIFLSAEGERIMEKTVTSERENDEQS